MSDEQQQDRQKQFLQDNNLQAPVGPVFKFPTKEAEETMRRAEAKAQRAAVAKAKQDLPQLQISSTSEAPVNSKKTGVIRTLNIVVLLASGTFAGVYFQQAEKKDGGQSSAQASLNAANDPNANLPPEVLAAQKPMVAEISPPVLAASSVSTIETLFIAKDYAGVITAAKNHACDAKEQNLLGIAYYSLQKYEQAAQAFSELEVLMPSDPIVKSNLADALLASGQNTAALEKYRQAAALNPTDPSYKKRIAQLERQMFAQANEKKARDKTPVATLAADDFTPRHIAPAAAEAYTFTDLRNAVERSDISMVESILAQGFDINKRDNSGQTLLISAINNNDLNMARFLILKGANPNLPGYDGYLPLMRAKANHPPNAELIRYLQSAGAVDQYAKR